MSSIKVPVKKGDRSLDVSRIQAVLVKVGVLKEKLPNGKPSVDGDFGTATETAVKDFQAQNSLPATGIVDAATLRALVPYRSVIVSGAFSQHLTLALPKLRLHPTTPFRWPDMPSLSLDSPTTGNNSPPAWDGKITRSSATSTPVSAPPPAPGAPTSSGAGWVLQPQASVQALTPPPSGFYNLPKGSTSPNASLTAPFQFWFMYRTAKDGMHLELAAGPSLSANYQFESTDPLLTGSINASITVADIFVRGSWHFLSPQLQFGGYANLDKDWNFLSSGITANVGDQMSVELIPDKLILQLTPGFWVAYDFKSQQVQVAPGASMAIQWNIPIP